MKHLSLLLGLLLLGGQSVAQQQRTYTSAESLATACRNVYISSGLFDKHGNPKKNADEQKAYALGQCDGYITGLLDGLDGTDFIAKDGAVKTVHVGYISSNQDVVTAFLKYLAENPLARNKTAQEVLTTVLLENNLIGVTVARPALKVTGDQ